MENKIVFQPAERRKAKLRLVFAGPSGSGKTYTSILVGKGLVGPEGRMAVLDTENQSASLYSHLAPFDHCVVTAPYTVEKYIQVIKAAEEAGYDLLIIDSATHVWKGSGGLLEQQDERAELTRNSFSAWRDTSRDYRLLIEAIVTSKIHIIVTLRSQTAYDMDHENEKGKRVPLKIGLKPEMRDGFDYEFTTVLNMTSTPLGHFATVSKDRTGLFDTKGPFVPGTDVGTALREWLENGTVGEGPTPVPDFPSAVIVPEKKRPANVMYKTEFEEVLKTYRQNGWDTAGILAAKYDDEIYDKDAVTLDFKLWNQARAPASPAAENPMYKQQQPVEKTNELVSSQADEPCENVAPPASTTNTHEEENTNQNADVPAQSAESPKVVPSTASGYACEKCGAEISKVQADVSKMFNGRPLCKACMEGK